MNVLKIILALFLPPVAAFLQVQFGAHFWINILLTLLGGLPGVVHALWLVVVKNRDQSAVARVGIARREPGMRNHREARTGTPTTRSLIALAAVSLLVACGACPPRDTGSAYCRLAEGIRIELGERETLLPDALWGCSTFPMPT